MKWRLDTPRCVRCRVPMPGNPGWADAAGWLRLGTDGGPWLSCPDCRGVHRRGGEMADGIAPVVRRPGRLS